MPRPPVQQSPNLCCDGEARHPGIEKNSVATAVPVVIQTVAESVGDGKVRRPEFEKHSTTPESDIAVSFGESGPSWPRANVRSTAVVKSFGEARRPGIARRSAMTEPELAESSDEVGPSWSKANGSAAATAAFKSAGEARPLGIAKESATKKPELAETSGELGLFGPRLVDAMPADLLVRVEPRRLCLRTKSKQNTGLLIHVECIPNTQD